MNLFFIYETECVFKNRIVDYFKVNHTHNCYKSCNLNEIKEEDFIIWFLENESFKNLLNLNSNIRELLSNNILFITAFEKDKILIGPNYIPNKNSGIDSSLFFFYNEKYKKIDEHLSSEIKLSSFESIPNGLFGEKIFFHLASKIENQILDHQLKLDSFFYNKVENFDLSTLKTEIKYIYPVFEKITPRLPKNLISDLNFIEKGKNNFNFSRKKKNNKYNRVGVVGGGTAGYLSAIALKTKYPDLHVSLIESSKIPIIGVGEATTPTLLRFLFKYLKFDKQEFYEKVQPTWKLGIKFFWGKPEADYFNYPFGENDLIAAFLNNNINEGSLASILMNDDSSFILKKDENDYSSFFNQNKIDYAFHLDNKKFVLYLKEKANAIGVELIDDTIEEVFTENFEKIDSLLSQKRLKYKFDFYIDCSGFKSLLIDKLDSKFVSFDNNLITDRALVGNVPNNGNFKPYTSAYSMKNGWCWNIPMRDSDHIGYVYSSKYCSELQAKKELSIKYPNINNLRLIEFKSGRHNSYIKGNVVAIGNSFGFVEPLESSGIHLIIKHIESFVNNFEILQEDDNNIIKDFLNNDIIKRWDYLKWFLSIHYKFNNKFDTPFWKYCRENIDLSDFQYLIDIYNSYGPLQTLNDDLANSVRSSFKDNLFGFYGIDNILLGQGVIPNNINKFNKVGEELWKFNVETWKEISKNTIPLKGDIDFLTKYPNII